jgi:hypothetical protein
MKTTLLTCLVLAGVAGSLQVATVRGQTPFALKLVATNETVKAGSEARIEITFTNTSDRDIHLSRPPGDVPDAEFSYDFEVRDEKGGLVPETRYGQLFKEHHGRIRGSWISRTLKPGDSIKETSIVNLLYDFSLPGKYTIQVSHDLTEGSSKGKVKSNTVTIVVAPA